MKHDQLMHQHTHNMHKGRVAMAMKCVSSIQSSKTVTKETAKLCDRIWADLYQLDKMLSTRVNLDGTHKEGLYDISL